MPESAHSLVLRRAAEELGGTEPLRERLRVSAPELEAWLAGAGKPPMPVFLETLHIAMARISRLHRDCEALRQTARRALEQAQRLRDNVLADMLEVTLEGALRDTGADMGNLQLACSGGLRIVAHRGFGGPFLDFYAVVNDWSTSSCGAAHKAGCRVVVTDVASDPIFAGTPAEPVMAAAGVRAVQSTPLLSPAGTLVGMLSTHYACPHFLTRHEEEILDRMAPRAASWLGLLARSGKPRKSAATAGEPFGVRCGSS